MGNTVDLHMHSTASDGSDSIPLLLENVKKAGLHTFAVTDHDTVAGSLAMEKLVGPELEFHRGIEFSCVSPEGKCHILGYDFDPDHEAFREALEEGRRLRAGKLQKRLDFLRETFGILLTEEEMAWLLSRKSPGKPHLGKLLVNRGLAPDLTTAINTFLPPCPGGDPGTMGERATRITADMAIKAILASGGVPIWAHPLGGEGERHLTEGEFLAQLGELQKSGIRGFECYYSRYPEEERNFLLEKAAERGLLISGGSDYHGTNKKNIQLGKLGADYPAVEPERLTVLTAL